MSTPGDEQSEEIQTWSPPAGPSVEPDEVVETILTPVPEYRSGGAATNRPTPSRPTQAALAPSGPDDPTADQTADGGIAQPRVGSSVGPDSLPGGYGMLVSGNLGDGYTGTTSGTTLGDPATESSKPAARPPADPTAVMPQAAEPGSMSTTATVTAADPTFVARRRNRFAPLIVAVVAPTLLVMIGLSLIVSAIGSGTSSGGSTGTPTHRAPRPATTDARPTSPKPADSVSAGSTGNSTSGIEPITAPVPVIPIPQVGGPTDRATAITQIFLSALAEENVQLARTMTDTDIDEKQLKSLDAASMFTVRSSEVGPDLVSERIVISEYRTKDARQTTTFICADWDVELATGRIHQLGSKQLGDVRDGVIVPGDLAATLGAECTTLKLN